MLDGRSACTREASLQKPCRTCVVIAVVLAYTLLCAPKTVASPTLRCMLNFDSCMMSVPLNVVGRRSLTMRIVLCII